MIRLRSAAWREDREGGRGRDKKRSMDRRRVPSRKDSLPYVIHFRLRSAASGRPPRHFENGVCSRIARIYLRTFTQKARKDPVPSLIEVAPARRIIVRLAHTFFSACRDCPPGGGGTSSGPTGKEVSYHGNVSGTSVGYKPPSQHSPQPRGPPSHFPQEQPLGPPANSPPVHVCGQVRVHTYLYTQACIYFLSFLLYALSSLLLLLFTVSCRLFAVLKESAIMLVSILGEHDARAHIEYESESWGRERSGDGIS